MKIAIPLLVLFLLTGISSIANAQNDGHPFKYTIVGDFVDGEPNPSYTAYGTPPMALVQVGTSVVFTVKNTDTRVRESAPWYSILNCDLAGPTFKTIFPIAPAPSSISKDDDINMLPNQSIDYSLHLLCSGNVAVGEYSAHYTFYIADGKTPDMAFKQGSKNVSVK